MKTISTWLTAPRGHIAVSEYFKTKQGEGPTAGHPAIFLRLQGCNLRCTWCDTIDTWIQGRVYSIDDLLNTWENNGYIEDLRRGHMIVITGGEPMIRSREITEFINRLTQRYNLKPRIEVETNGTIHPTEDLLELVDQFNVSPKLSNSLMPLKVRYRRRVLGVFADSGKAIFKFVVSSEEDIPEVLWYIETTPLPKDKVYLMPESKTREEYLLRVNTVQKLCEKYGLKLSPRLHLLYGWK